MTSQPIRVAFVITELAVGGAEKCLVRIATGLDQADFSPTVYSLGPPPPADKAALVDQLSAAGVPTHFVGVRHAWQLPTAIRSLRRVWKQNPPQIIQTFLYHANVAGTLAAARFPDSRLVHGIRVADPSRWRQRVERWAMKKADLVVCVSRSVADFCAASLAVPQHKLAVVPNGVDIPPNGSEHDESVLTALGVPPKARTLVFVGRLHPQKGLDWLFGLLPDVFARFPDAHLLLVGDGPERLPLKSQAAAIGIDDRVHFAGWRPDVPAILAESTALVLPSRWEGMPNALLEAMAAGLPVVATQAEGVVEILGELAEPQTVSFGDDRGFVDRIERLLTNEDQPARLGTANRERVAERFSWDPRIRDYANLYCSLVERGSEDVSRSR